MTWNAINMELSSIFERASVQAIGERAWDILTSSSRGKVLARFSKAIYLSSSQNEILWLTAGDSPMHRRGIKLQGTLPKPAAGSTYRVHADTLEFEGGFQISLDQLRVWKPERVQSYGRFCRSEISRTLYESLTSLWVLPSPKGFGCLLPEIVRMTGGKTKPNIGFSKAPVLQLAWPGVRDTIEALRLQSYEQVLPSAAQIIGLGEGLTPSGDDYLGGLLFAREMLTKSLGDVPVYQQHDLNSFLAYAKRNTNAISYTILADHAKGYGMETLHQFVYAILGGEPTERIQNLMVRLITVGHSTGWDFLAGALTGMLVGVGEKSAIKAHLT